MFIESLTLTSNEIWCVYHFQNLLLLHFFFSFILFLYLPLVMIVKHSKWNWVEVNNHQMRIMFVFPRMEKIKRKWRPKNKKQNVKTEMRMSKLNRNSRHFIFTKHLIWFLFDCHMNVMLLWLKHSKENLIKILFYHNKI